jgi:IS1 family transposase
MNKLTREQRAQILHMLCEGNSIRAIERMTGSSKHTISKLLVDAGKACAAYHDEHVRGVKAKRVQCDEIWSFTYAKQKNVAGAKAAPEDAGDTWTWTALDADSKLIVSWLVGGRDAEYANAFMQDVAGRLANRVQLTTDGHKPYLEAVEGAFGADVDFAQLVKIYGAVPKGDTRYSPAECLGAKKRRVEGAPDKAHVSTSYVERQNLTMRMHMRRFTRLTNGFSKKIENHAHAVALHFMYYNFVKQHKGLKGVSPAMAAGVTTRLWEMSDIVDVVDAAESVPTKRGPYKKRATQENI